MKPIEPEPDPPPASKLEVALTEAAKPLVLPPQEPLTTAGSGPVLIRGLSDLMAFADLASKSGLAPKGMGPNAIAVVVQFGLEIGIGPVQAMQTFCAINGKISAYGTGLIALATRHPAWGGMTETLEGEGDARTATCTVHRKGCPDKTSKFSLADARKAGLLDKKDSPWKDYPDRMLASKPRGWAIRDQFADSVWGAIPEDEARDYPQR